MSADLQIPLCLNGIWINGYQVEEQHGAYKLKYNTRNTLIINYDERKMSWLQEVDGLVETFIFNFTVRFNFEYSLLPLKIEPDIIYFKSVSQSKNYPGIKLFFYLGTIKLIYYLGIRFPIFSGNGKLVYNSNGNPFRITFHNSTRHLD